MELQGIGASPGIVIGKAYVVDTSDVTVKKQKITEQQVEREVDRLRAALARTKEELFELKRKVSSEVGERQAAIFNAHLMFLDDPTLLVETSEHIRREKHNAAWVVHQFVERYVALFEAAQDPHMRDRYVDIRDVGKRLIRHLEGNVLHQLQGLEEGVVVVARELGPSDTAQMDTQKVRGFVTDVGGRTSHTAIMARTLELPAVVGLEIASKKVKTGDIVIVDGTDGMLVVNPDKEQLAHYRKRRRQILAQEQALTRLRKLPAQTTDGVKITLAANIELPEESRQAMARGAEGVGLFRTEFLFLNRNNLPTEDEQFEAYRLACKICAPHPVVIRTLDLGGDKFLSHLDLAQEMNPFLGLRAIRLCLAHPYIFKVQLRAILRASHFGKLKIMFPLVSGLEELRQAQALVREVKQDLQKRGIPFDNKVEMGAMIEVPSAAITADLLAKEVDFFSVGTNDLIQYTMAVDRANERIAYLYDPLHPAILRTIKMVIDAAHKEKIWVGLCGEMAGDPFFTLILLGMGLDEFSTSAISIPEVKAMIRSVDFKEAEAVARDVLGFSTSAEIRDYLSKSVVGKLLSQR
jgi:phosphotransferase system enzyme I (PtsI)